MAQLAGGYVTLAKLEQIVATVKAKNDKGFSFTISVNDDQNDYGQNIALFASQTKDQQTAKAPKWYFGNAKTFWSNKDEYIPPRKEDFNQTDKVEEGDDLPF